MKKLILTLTFIAIGIFIFSQQKRYIDEIKFPKLNDIQPPEVKEYQLSNGITLLCVEDYEFPTFNIRAMVKSGKVAEPLEKNGLVELFGDVLRSGGTKNMKSDDMDKYLDKIGASIESYEETSFIGLSASCLKENADDVLKIFSEILMYPAFEEEKVELAKTQLRSMISRRNDEPMEVLVRELNKILYGKDSPYARQIEYWDVDNLKKEDLINFHKTYFRPDMTYIAVWGAFKAEEMKQKVEKYLGGWNVSSPKPEIKMPVIPESNYSVNQIEKNDVEQSFIFMGKIGLRYDDPDYAPTYILTEILGGGFSSRLFKKIRTEMGLAYSAGSYMVPAFDHRGMFYFYTSTKPSTTTVALSAMLDEIKKIRESQVTDEELKTAKEGFLNSFAFQFDSTAKLINRMLNYKFYGYPLNFNRQVRDAIEKVTKDDVLRVAQKYLEPDKLTIVVLGKIKEFDAPLTKFGNVNTIDITIPTSKKVELAANPQAETKALELIKKAIKAIGEIAFNSLKDYYSEGKANLEGMEVPFKAYLLPPDKYAGELLFGEVAMKLVMDGDVVFAAQGTFKQNLPSSEAESIKKSFYTEGGGLMLLKGVLEGKLKAQYLKEGTYAGNPAELVLVDTPSGYFLLFLDKKSGLLQAVRYEEMGEKGKEEVVEIFKAHKDVQGLKIPMEVTVTVNNQPKSSTKIWKVKLNGGISPTIFK